MLVQIRHRLAVELLQVALESLVLMFEVFIVGRAKHWFVKLRWTGRVNGLDPVKLTPGAEKKEITGGSPRQERATEELGRRTPRHALGILCRT